MDISQGNSEVIEDRKKMISCLINAPIKFLWGKEKVNIPYLPQNLNKLKLTADEEFKDLLLCTASVAMLLGGMNNSPEILDWVLYMAHFFGNKNAGPILSVFRDFIVNSEYDVTSGRVNILTSFLLGGGIVNIYSILSSLREQSKNKSKDFSLPEDFWAASARRKLVYRYTSVDVWFAPVVNLGKRINGVETDEASKASNKEMDKGLRSLGGGILSNYEHIFPKYPVVKPF
jgi:hypothetical protein